LQIPWPITKDFEILHTDHFANSNYPYIRISISTERNKYQVFPTKFDQTSAKETSGN